MPDVLVRAEGLVKEFPVGRGEKSGAVQAVAGIDFTVKRQETLGMVGESGCGKSTTGRLALRILDPTGGRVFFDGVDLCTLDAAALRAARRDFCMIFQDPFSSLDPRMSIAEIITEPMSIAGATKKERQERAKELLEVVGLAPYHATRFPHEFSGGQRQRIGIARALSTNPRFIVCDEPVSALDVSVQAQIVNLLKDLQESFALTYLFISHDLSVVRHISDRVVVLYLGKVMEEAPRDALFENPRHPYTQALLSAVPNSARLGRQRIILSGELPSPVNPPSGCRFHTRCWKTSPICREQEPEFRSCGADHIAACHNVDCG